MQFREITIPGDVLEDDNLPDGAKILYGKIARLSYKNGYCWASNEALSGTKSGKTASRNIRLLEKCGYIRCVYENQMQSRKIYICQIDSKIHWETPPKNGETPPKNGEGPLPKMGNKQYKMNNQREQPKKTEGPFSLAEKLNPQFADFSRRLEKLISRYNDLKIGPPFRKTVVNLNPSETSDLMNIMSVYQDDISLKAMENYSKVIHDPNKYDPGGCTYKSFISFIVRGVEKYCDEAEPFERFKKKILNGRFPSKQDRHFDISQPKELI